MTARVNKEASLNDQYILLQQMATKYSIHRFFVSADKVFLSNFTANYKDYVVTSDFSENIHLKPKFEAQSAHFSGKQQTLHCELIEKEG